MLKNQFYRAFVVDNNPSVDNKSLNDGRITVRVFGIHSENIKKDDLLLAQPCLPISFTGGANKEDGSMRGAIDEEGHGTGGRYVVPQTGSVVWGFFEYGNPQAFRYIAMATEQKDWEAQQKKVDDALEEVRKLVKKIGTDLVIVDTVSTNKMNQIETIVSEAMTTIIDHVSKSVSIVYDNKYYMHHKGGDVQELNSGLRVMSVGGRLEIEVSEDANIIVKKGDVTIKSEVGNVTIEGAEKVDIKAAGEVNVNALTVSLGEENLPLAGVMTQLTFPNDPVTGKPLPPTSYSQTVEVTS